MTSPLSRAPSASPPTVLFADDDPVMRALFRQFAARAGWDPVIVEDGDSTIKQLSQREFDVVITDFRMPKLEGLPLLKKIKGTHPLQALIVVTGSITVSELVATLKEGAQDIIQKPVDFFSLEHSVNRILSNSDQREFEETLIGKAIWQTTLYRFKSLDLASRKLQLPQIHQLHATGLISLHEKLSLELAVQEALANSLEHGNLELESIWKEQIDAQGLDQYSIIKGSRLKQKRYGDRTISIKVGLTLKRLAIEIQDQGKGFNFQPLLRKRRSLTQKCYGRGIPLIKEAFDQVQYSLNGRKIRMVKKLPRSSWR
ncbi:MAG: hypothetical protein DCC75_05870 [Proteobacteria bacterium]|nr:MAG: hypothetical protein DCC75_05870 [Pseudomonadota bacterium]